MISRILLLCFTISFVAAQCPKGKLNLNYKATNNPNTMYRALQIRKPSPELSGEYKCLVSTFLHEASETKKMVIFVPQRDFRFWHTVEITVREENSVAVEQQQIMINVTCLAEGVFPEPIIKILSASEPVATPEIIRKLRNGLYDVTASYQMETEAESNEHTFECELTIPGTNYTVRKVLFVTPVVTTTPYEFESTTPTTEDPLDSLYPDYFSTTSELSTTIDWLTETTPSYDYWENSTTEIFLTSPEPVESNHGPSWHSSKFLTASSLFILLLCLL